MLWVIGLSGGMFMSQLVCKESSKKYERKFLSHIVPDILTTNYSFERVWNVLKNRKFTLNIPDPTLP